MSIERERAVRDIRYLQVTLNEKFRLVRLVRPREVVDEVIDKKIGSTTF
jgi:hypothetical protein